MSSRPTAIERAFELARSGGCGTVSDLRRQLKIEGYAADQISGPMLLRQLRELVAVAKANAGD